MFNQEFYIGDVVMHEEYGTGTIVDYEWYPDGDLRYVNVDFSGEVIGCYESDLTRVE